MTLSSNTCNIISNYIYILCTSKRFVLVSPEFRSHFNFNFNFNSIRLNSKCNYLSLSTNVQRHMIVEIFILEILAPSLLLAALLCDHAP